MTARAATLKRNLALTTALAGLAAFPAAAQTTISGFGTYTTTPTSAEAGAAAPTITSSGSTQLAVTLNAKNTIVNWNDLNIPQGSTANFSNNGTTTTGATAVLNRVTVAGAGNTTTLGGTITADHSAGNQVQVWVINPNGILVGNGASFNTAGLVLSTLDLTNDNDFLNGGGGGLYSVNLAGAGSTASISGGDLTTTITTNNGILALVAPNINVTAAMNTGSSPAAFALATDVSLQTTVGGPLSITLNAGTTLGGSVAGTIVGDRVYALLRPDTVTGNLLAVDASVTHATVDATGAVVLSGDSQTASFANGDTLSTGATAAGVSSNARLGAVSVGGSGATNAAVIVNATGTATLSGVIDGASTVSVTGGSGIQLSAATITTTGAQTYNNAVTLLGDVSLAAGAGAVGFTGTVDSDTTPRALTITSSGTTSFGGLVGSNAALASLSSTGGTTAFNAAGAGAATPTVKTTGAQTYGAVTLGADATFASSGGGASFGAIAGSGRALQLSLAGATMLANVGTVADPLASLTSDGAATLGGAILTYGNQTYTGAVTLTGGSTVRLDAGSTGTIAFASTVGGAADLTLAGSATASSGLGITTALTSLTTTGTLGLTGNVATSGAQSYAGTLTVAGDATLSGTTASFTGAYGVRPAVAGSGNLTLAFTGAQALDGATFTDGTNGFASLTVGPTGGTGGATTSLTGGFVTSNALTFNNVATLVGNVTLSTGAGGVTFNTTLDSDASARTLTITTAGPTLLGASVGAATNGALGSLTTGSGPVTIGSSTSGAVAISTTGAQGYGGAVTLAAAATLSAGGTGFTFNGVSGGGNDLTLTGTATSATKTIDGSFTGIRNLMTTGGGTTTLAGAVTTSGFQNYGDAVALAGATTLSAGGTGFTFTGLTGGGNDLTLTGTASTATKTIDGSITGLRNLITTGSGATTLSGAITTTGYQSYGDPITLSGTTTLSAGGTGFTFAGLTGAGFDLTLTGTATTARKTIDGSFTGIGNLATTGSGTTTLSGAVTTTGYQNYGDPVTLAAATTLSAGGTGFAFAGVTGGGFDLILTGTATTATKLIDGGFTGIRNLVTSGVGTTTLSGAVATSGSQNYGDPATLAAATTLSAGGTGFTFAGVTGAGFDLTLTGTASIATKTIDGSFTGIRNLATTGSGTTTLNGAVTTSGFQSYGDAVTLAGATVLSSAGTGFVFGGVTGAGNDLTLTGTAATSIKAIGSGFTGINNLTTTGSGTTTLSDTVATGGYQHYGDAVSLTAATVLSAGGNGFTFSGVAGGGFDLTLTGTAASASKTIDGGFTGIRNLATTGSGATALTGTVVTSGFQNYGDPATLAGATVLSAGGTGFVFSGVTGAGFDLTLTGTVTTATKAIDGGFTGIRNLATTGIGTTTLSGTVSTTGTQSYGDAATLSSDVTLTSSGTGGAGAITFGGTLVGGHALTVSTAGTATFGGAVGGSQALTSLTVSPGSTRIAGASITTTGAQSYAGAVTLGGDTALTAATIAFAAGVNGNDGTRDHDLGIATSGAKTIDGGYAGIRNLTVGGGGAAMLAGNVTTSGFQSYADPVTLAGAVALSAGGSGFVFHGVTGAGNDLMLTGTATTAGKTIDGSFTGLRNLVTAGIGTTTLAGAVTTTGYQHFGDVATLAAATTLSAGATGFTFAGVAGAGFDLSLTGTATTATKAVDGSFTGIRNLATTGVGTTTLSGAVTTTGYQTYGDWVTLTGATTLSAGGTGFVFSGVTGAGNDLTLIGTATTATKTIDGGVSGVRNLATAGAGTTTLSGSVTTTGSQSYGDPVTLASATTLSAGGTGFVFSGVAGAGFDLTLTGTATTATKTIDGGFTGIRNLATTGIGTTSLNGAVTTSGTQSYGDPVTLAGATMLSAGGTGFTFSGVTGGGNDLTLTGTATTATETIDGSFTGVRNLATTGVGTTMLNGTVTTTGFQNYGDPVTLAGATTLSAGGTGLTFSGAAGGGFDLTLTGTATTATKAIAGGFTGIRNFATNGLGTTSLAGTVATSGTQSYGDATTLATDAMLSSSGAGAIGFASTVDGASALTVATAGTTTFGGAVDGAQALTSLAVSTGPTAINGGTIRSTGAQSYTGAVTLGADTALTGASVAFVAGVNGNDGTRDHDLTLSTSGAETIDGGFTGIRNLTATGGGATRLNGTVTTSGFQRYDDAVTLAAATTRVVAGTGAVSFYGTVDAAVAGAQALSVSTSGTTTFGGTVGASARLASLTTSAGPVALNASVATTGGQSYGGPATLGASTVALDSSGGGAVTFAGTLAGSGAGASALTVTTTGLTTLDGAVGGGGGALASLSIIGGGATAINGGAVTTTGGQSYGGTVTILGDATLNAATGSFTGVYGVRPATDDTGSLALNFTSAQALAGGTFTDGTHGFANFTLGPVGGTAGATKTLSGGFVVANAAAFNDAVALGGDVTVRAGVGGVTFANTIDAVNAGGPGLSITTAGTTTLAGPIGTIARLSSLATSTGPVALNTGSIRTTGNQSYGGAVTLGADAVLDASTGVTPANIAFASTVDGARSLTLVADGTRSFAGSVGSVTALGSVTSRGATAAATGKTAFGASAGVVRTAAAVGASGGQSYAGAVTLGRDTVFSGVDGGFGAITGNVHALTLSFTGATTLATVGGVTSLVSDGGGTTTLTGDVATSATQRYADNVVLGSSVTLSSTGAGAAGNVTFAGTLDATSAGVQGLTVTTAGTTSFGGQVGASAALGSLAAGTTLFAVPTPATGSSVTTTGAQSYGATTLALDTVLTGGSVAFAGPVDAMAAGGQALTVNASGATIFNGAVGAGTALANLTTDPGGTTAINGGSVRTTGAQTYNDRVTLGAATVLTGTTGVFAGGLEGNDNDLTLNFSGMSTLDGSITGVRNLVTDATGGTILNGALTTSGGQTYNDAVTLGSAVTLTSSGSAAITFATTVNGAQELVVNTGGMTTFGGAVGNLTALASLATDAGGTTLLNGGSVATTGGQAYRDAVSLGTATVLSSSGAGTIGFATTLDGARSLAVNTGGATMFGGAVGGTAALASLTVDAGGTSSINGGSVRTTGSQAYGDAVTLGASTVLSSSGNGPIGFGSTIDAASAGVQALTINTGGFTTFGGAIGNVAALASLTTDVGGTTVFNGGSITTSGGQTYGDAVTLGAETVLTSTGAGTIGFATTLDGGQALVVNTGGATVFGGAVGATNALTSLATDAAGTTAINGGSVRTTGSQTYGDAATLGASTVLSSSAGGAIGFASSVNAASAGVQSLTANTTGVTAFGGALGKVAALASLATDAGGTTLLNGGSVATTGGQAYGDAVTLGATTVLSSSGAGTIGFATTLDGAQSLVVSTGGATVFGGAVGGTTALTSLATDVGGTTAINGGAVRTTGGQSYGDAVRLGASAVLSSIGSGAIGFGSTVDAASAGVQALTVNTGGVTTFGGAVGGTVTLASLTTDAVGSTALNGGSVTTTGGQTYGDAVTLGAATVLSSSGAGTIGFATTLDGARSLAVNTAGSTVFGGAVGATAALASVATDAGGTTSINGGSVRTTGAQAYGDAVILGASAVLSSSGGGSIGFATTLDGASAGVQALTVNAGGVTTFGGAVGNVAALASLATDAGGTTVLNGGSVATTGGQAYGDAVTLGAATVLSSSAAGTIGFATTLDGAQSLAVNTGGATVFGGVVGATTALASLATDAGGTTAINGGSVRTTGAQGYGDAVTLGASTVLTSSANGSIGFGSTINAASGGVQSLTVNTGGTTIFGGAVGTVAALASLTTDAGGSTALNGGSVATTGGQIYGDAVTLGSATTLTSSAAGTIGFATTLDGAQSLVVNTGGATSFGGAVGGTMALASLATDAPGTTAINGGSVRTTGSQGYGDAVTLGASTLLASSGNGAVGFATTVNAASAGVQSLTVNTGGVTTFAGAVGNIAALASLVTDAGGATAINGGSVATTGGQSYGDAATLGGDARLSSSGGGALSFAGTVDGGYILSLTTSGATRLGGVLGGVTPLTGLALRTGSFSAVSGNRVGTIAASVASGGLVYDDAAALTIGTVDGLSGISTGTAAATVSAGGVLALATNVAAGDTGLTGIGVTQAAGTSVNAGAGTILIDANDGAIAMAGSLTTTNATANAVRVIDSAGAVLGTIATGAGGGVTLGLAGGDALSGNVAQTAGTTIATGMLTGSIGGVATLANAGNSIATLGALATNGLALRDSRTGLSVVGPVSAGSGNLALMLDAGTLAIQGNLVAPTGVVSLVVGGAIGQIGGTIVADTLTGSSTGGASFTAAGNMIARLAGFANAGSGGFTLTDARALAATGDTTTAGDLTINAVGIDFTGRTISGTGALTLVGNGGAVVGGTATGGTTATVTAASINIGTVRAAGGPLALTATGAGGAGLTVGTASTTGTATLASQAALGVTGSLTAGTSATLTATGAATLGQMATGTSLTVTANLITAGTTKVGTMLSFTSGGGISLASAQVGTDALFDANGTAALGSVTAGSTSGITVRALDAQITGAQTAAKVSFVNRSPTSIALKLGNGTSAGGFALAQDEVNFVNAPTLVFDGGTGNVEMGALAFAGAAGAQSVSVLATGRIDVTGAVSGSGAGRSFLLGGTASATGDKASVIEVVAKPSGAAALLFDTADLELRGARIGVGQQPGFLTPIGFDGATGQPVAAVSTAYVGNANSSLYNATFGGIAYATSATLVSAHSLTVRYTDYALFQNTGSPGTTSGVVLGGSTAAPVRNALVLDGGGSTNNAFALFGTINGITGTGTALLGAQVISFTATNLSNTRVNGCLVASGAGCLTSVVSQPVLNVFDASRLNVFRSADDLAVPFDPVVGNNNEALFSGIAVLDGPVVEPKCEGSDDPACKAPEKQPAAPAPAPADEKKPK